MFKKNVRSRAYDHYKQKDNCQFMLQAIRNYCRVLQGNIVDRARNLPRFSQLFVNGILTRAAETDLAIRSNPGRHFERDALQHGWINRVDAIYNSKKGGLLDPDHPDITEYLPGVPDNVELQLMEVLLNFLKKEAELEDEQRCGGSGSDVEDEVEPVLKYLMRVPCVAEEEWGPLNVQGELGMRTRLGAKAIIWEAPLPYLLMRWRPATQYRGGPTVRRGMPRAMMYLLENVAWPPDIYSFTNAHGDTMLLYLLDYDYDSYEAGAGGAYNCGSDDAGDPGLLALISANRKSLEKLCIVNDEQQVAMVTRLATFLANRMSLEQLCIVNDEHQVAITAAVILALKVAPFQLVAHTIKERMLYFLRQEEQTQSLEAVADTGSGTTGTKKGHDDARPEVLGATIATAPEAPASSQPSLTRPTESLKIDFPRVIFAMKRCRSEAGKRKGADNTKGVLEAKAMLEEVIDALESRHRLLLNVSGLSSNNERAHLRASPRSSAAQSCDREDKTAPAVQEKAIHDRSCCF
ncbi:unnamed protein product [Amoebophrya sp. A25]|nr:unnamed protein product [Amoebophrya sp. A25]|eukprot:GSA25T00010216001.1